MKTTTSPIFRTWKARIASGTFTKSQCRVWAQTVATLAAHDTPRRRTALTTEEAEQLFDLLDAAPVRLTDDHTAQGLTWLRSAQGRRQLGLPGAVLDTFDHFAFLGHAVEGTPVYRIVTTDHRGVDYFVQSWQSGGWSSWWAVAPVLASLDGGNRLASGG